MFWVMVLVAGVAPALLAAFVIAVVTFVLSHRRDENPESR